MSAFAERYGPWAIVAGASEGLGEAFARGLAEAGLNLVLVARRGKLLGEVAAELGAKHRIEVRPIALDLASSEAASRLGSATVDLDVGLLVYNAAFAPIGEYLAVTPEEHRAVLGVNCYTPALLCHEFGQRMVARGRGGMVLMSSLAGLHGSPGISHYAATKAYTLVLAEGLWAELGGRGVDVLGCCAGATLTPGYQSNPAPPRLLAPPVMHPAEVVREALGALGRRPCIIPGRWNRIASFLLGLLPRRRAVLLMRGSTAKLGG
jgi:short-subunit dehydrogenase